MQILLTKVDAVLTLTIKKSLKKKKKRTLVRRCSGRDDTNNRAGNLETETRHW